MLHGCIARTSGGEGGEAVADTLGDALSGAERGRRRLDADGAAGVCVAADAIGDGSRAAIAVEAGEVEAELARARPQVGVVLATLVEVDRPPQLPERLLMLKRGGLGRRVQRGRARVLGLDREVAHAEPQPEVANRDPGRRALGAAEVEVDDRLDAGAADVVVRADRRRRRARAQRRSPRSATNAR